ncbi:hypothetical protein ACO1C8_04670 [Staphylococcus hominis]
MPSIIYVFFKRKNPNTKHPKFFDKILIGYIITVVIAVLIAFFEGFYSELKNINDKQGAILYIMYLITFIFIYAIHFFILKRSTIYSISDKIFRIIIYSIILLISFLTYGIAPICNLDIFQKHISIWNNTLTTLIVFEALFFLIFTKQND